MTPVRPRVVLLEDDASIRQFVEMALEDSPVALSACETVAEAIAEFERAEVALVITDLMLRGESGIDLIERLVAYPSLRRGAVIAVFSAGLNSQVRQTLERHGVTLFLQKPVSLRELRACVASAIEGSEHAGGNKPASAAESIAAVDLHFGGDADLYDAFARSSHAQFARDIEAGDLAIRTGDLAALRRLAHSLKSVLRMLGADDPAGCAASLERSCEAGDDASARRGWLALRDKLAALAGPGGG